MFAVRKCRKGWLICLFLIFFCNFWTTLLKFLTIFNNSIELESINLASSFQQSPLIYPLLCSSPIKNYYAPQLNFYFFYTCALHRIHRLSTHRLSTQTNPRAKLFQNHIHSLHIKRRKSPQVQLNKLNVVHNIRVIEQYTATYAHLRVWM